MTPEQMQKRIEQLEYKIDQLIKVDRYLFTRKLDLQNVTIGTTAQSKLSFHGALPVVQAGAISSPGTDGASLKTAVDAIRTVLINKGLTV